MGGLRTKKTNALGGRFDVYTYVDEGCAWGEGETPFDTNCVMSVESSDASGLIAATSHYYNDLGRIERILTRSPSQVEYSGQQAPAVHHSLSRQRWRRKYALPAWI